MKKKVKYTIIEGNKFVNLTDHPIQLLHKGKFIEIPKSGIVTKTNYEVLEQGVRKTFKYNYVVGLPGPEENTYYIVSALTLNGVRKLHPERTDVVAPFKVQKYDNGVTYCEGLRHNG